MVAFNVGQSLGCGTNKRAFI